MNLDLLPEHIASRVEPEPMSGCWLWTAAATSAGYGELRWEGKVLLAHRLVYELLVGPIPEGLQIDHLCGNRVCVSPWHMEPVTQRVNGWRGRYGGSQTHCRNGHLYDEANTYVYRGCRYCRTCNRAGQRKRAARRRAAS